MTHYSQIAHKVFLLIKQGQRIIEPRLNDVAHQNVRIGDLIVFIDRQTRSEVVVKVVGVLRYPRFDDLFAAFPLRYFGVAERVQLTQEVAGHYSREDEIAHGVLGIKLHALRKIS